MKLGSWWDPRAASGVAAAWQGLVACSGAGGDRVGGFVCWMARARAGLLQRGRLTSPRQHCPVLGGLWAGLTQSPCADGDAAGSCAGGTHLMWAGSSQQ